MQACLRIANRYELIEHVESERAIADQRSRMLSGRIGLIPEFWGRHKQRLFHVVVGATSSPFRQAERTLKFQDAKESRYSVVGIESAEVSCLEITCHSVTIIC